MKTRGIICTQCVFSRVRKRVVNVGEQHIRGRVGSGHSYERTFPSERKTIFRVRLENLRPISKIHTYCRNEYTGVQMFAKQPTIKIRPFDMISIEENTILNCHCITEIMAHH